MAVVGSMTEFESMVCLSGEFGMMLDIEIIFETLIRDCAFHRAYRQVKNLSSVVSSRDRVDVLI